MFSFRYINKSLELCQVIVSHFVTLNEDSAAPGSESQNCSTETGRKILHYGEKHGECSVLVCTKEQDFYINYKEKKLNS
jgi:hypothetical protein